MDWFSIVTVALCLGAAIGCLFMDNYLTALIFVVAVYNIGSWMWLEQFKGKNNGKRLENR
jgi:hypothetical protein